MFTMFFNSTRVLSVDWQSVIRHLNTEIERWKRPKQSGNCEMVRQKRNQNLDKLGSMSVDWEGFTEIRRNRWTLCVVSCLWTNATSPNRDLVHLGQRMTSQLVYGTQYFLNYIEYIVLGAKEREIRFESNDSPIVRSVRMLSRLREWSRHSKEATEEMEWRRRAVHFHSYGASSLCWIKISFKV